MQAFRLNPVFSRDFLCLGRLALSRVLLMNDARYPWLTLVPERPDIVEIIDLEPGDRTVLMNEIAAASEAIRMVQAPDKLNVGALGNHVPQLHVHVIGRFVSDPAWPGPVWGHSPAVPYPPHAAGIAADRLAAALAPHGLREVQP